MVLLNGCEQIVHQSHLSCLDFLAIHLVQPLLKHLTHLNTVDTLFHFVAYGLTLTHDSVTIALDVNVQLLHVLQVSWFELLPRYLC